MKIIYKQLLSALIFVTALIPAFSQTSGPQITGIDPAVLTKANAGDTASQAQVGDIYAAGLGVPKDYKQAADWYMRAAWRGDLGAQLRLAALFRDGGKGFPRDMAQAAAWYRKAAEQGEPSAQAALGILYSFGQGVPQSDVEAFYWLDLAAAVKGPNQEKYAASRQMIGTRITTDELAAIQDRVDKWLAANRRPGPVR
ncbi:MAG: tetratricopeptide repeat protein [Terracidiphilus sp.]